MKREGEVRIPSGCAIAAVISRDGKGITGDVIYNSMKPMHDRSNGLGGGFAPTAYIPNTRICSLSTSSSTTAPPARSARLI